VAQENMIAAPQANGGAPFSGARTAPTVAFTDGKYSYDSFFDVHKHGVKRGVVWHLDGKKIIATWSPEQLGCSGFYDVWNACRAPAPFALSPDGRYLAETRSHQVCIYGVATD
jgi:hypothetical protein